jgi:hypothetical protein
VLKLSRFTNLAKLDFTLTGVGNKLEWQGRAGRLLPQTKKFIILLDHIVCGMPDSLKDGQKVYVIGFNDQ